MIIRLANEEDKNNWDEYVYSHPDASPCHLYAWRMTVENAYGHRAYYLLAEEGGQITGVLPLIYLKLPFISGQLVSLPFCDAGDSLTRDEYTKEKLILEAVSLAQKLKAKYIELRSRVYTSSFEYLKFPVSIQSHKVRMVLELPQSSDLLWDSFKSKLRSQLRKAEKNSLEFKWGSLDNLEDFYVVFSRNMRDLGSPVHSREWFYAVLTYYGKNIRMGLIYYNRQLIGVGIILIMNNMISIPWASTLRDCNKLSPNMLLYWNFLKFASDSGYAIFDFGRSTPNEGTYQFKAQWGAKPVPLHWHYILINNKELNFDTHSSAKREKIARLWQSLPLKMANYIGPAIRKHISL